MFFRSPQWDSLTYWALDVETGGFESRADPIIAIGMVPVRGGTIRLGESYRTLVRPENGRTITPASVRAHQLVWSEVEAAPTLCDVLPEVARRLREGVLLVHQQAIDVAFLRRDFKRTGLQWPSPRVVDTVDLLVRIARLTTPELPHEGLALNLSRARKQHRLPDYQAHDPLTDAIATAELFLVLRKSLGARTLRDLL